MGFNRSFRSADNLADHLVGASQNGVYPVTANCPATRLMGARVLGDARPSLHGSWHSTHTLAVAVRVFEFELIVQ